MGDHATQDREAVEKAARAAARTYHGSDAYWGPLGPLWTAAARAALNAAGVPALRAEVEHWKARWRGAESAAVSLRNERDEARQQVADLRAVVESARRVLDDTPLILSAIARDVESTPEARGGVLRFEPGTPGHGASGCPGDNVTHWLSRLVVALAGTGEQPGEAWCEHYAPGAECAVCRPAPVVPDDGSPAWAWANRPAAARIAPVVPAPDIPGPVADVLNRWSTESPIAQMVVAEVRGAYVRAQREADAPVVPDSAGLRQGVARAVAFEEAGARLMAVVGVYATRYLNALVRAAAAGASVIQVEEFADRAVMGQGVTAECDPWAGCPVHGDKHWRAALEHAVSRVEVRAERAERALAAVVRSGEQGGDRG